MSITTIIGPMFSGKTTELARQINRKKIAGKKCLVIKHAKDTRYGVENITTHDNQVYTGFEIHNLGEVNQSIAESYIGDGYQVIGIDEGFFFAGICSFCNELANNDIEVFVSTLDSSYKQELFPEIGDLIANSEFVIKIDAVCMVCGNEHAGFTIRTVKSDQEILVGGKDMYKSVCRSCLKAHM